MKVDLNSELKGLSVNIKKKVSYTFLFNLYNKEQIQKTAISLVLVHFQHNKISKHSIESKLFLIVFWLF